ncbi:GntR family transcriptional regulator [Nocardioides sp. KR10-350]|uniref:GntR family transcriptional regulator n=1 Tax=Nocardioides cheoyonin TaxID=3156615 RepID=UPI0032B4295B
MTATAPAARRAYDAVKDRILSGSFPAGELLSEVEVAHELALSRTPVHEAFLRLEAEDLLRLIPRRGAVVVPVPPHEAADILDVRRALETAAARRLATGTPSYAAARERLAERLSALATEQDGHAAARDVEAFAIADEEFHRAIVTASGNALADRFYATLADRQRRMTVGSVGGRPEHLPVLVAEHRRLAALVTEGDAEAFEEALVSHLEATHDLLLGRGGGR